MKILNVLRYALWGAVSCYVTALVANALMLHILSDSQILWTLVFGAIGGSVIGTKGGTR